MSVTNNDVCLAIDDWLNQVGNTVLWVLVVAIGIDDDVGAVTQSIVNTVSETACQPHIATVMHEVFNAKLFGDFNGFVSRSVIDNQPLDFVDVWQLLRHFFKYEWQRRFFV